MAASLDLDRRAILAALTAGTAAPTLANAPEGSSFPSQRAGWVSLLARICEPVLSAMAADRLKATMPVECPSGKRAERRAVTHLEALGRVMAGIGPWLEASGLDRYETAVQTRFADLAIRSIRNAVDPKAADHIGFEEGAQNVVDAAFLVVGLHRAKNSVWRKLPPETRSALIESLRRVRRFKPPESNWLLFASVREAFLADAGADWDEPTVHHAIEAHQGWYKGDGVYGDGADFHWDYYNSFVIHPLLIETLDLLEPVTDRWQPLRASVEARAARYAAIQERVIAPDGSFPPVGRSIAYRCGAFHHLALTALRRCLPPALSPAQVRCALASVIARTMHAPGTFDADGWLRIGLAGAQPSLAEPYISTGSLYLATTAFLPLGLPPSDRFWADPDAPWTARRIWTGIDEAADHHL